MQLIAAALTAWFILAATSAAAEPVRAAYPSANVQFLPAFVALEKGFYKREGLDAELVSVRSAVDLKGKKIGVSFRGSTFAGTKAILELNKMNPDKDVQYVSIPGSSPKIAAMQQGIIQAALLAPLADYLAVKAGFRRLVHLADIFKETSFTGLAATGKTIKDNPQFVKRTVRAIVRGVFHARDNPEDAIQTMMKHLRMERDAALDAYQLIRESLNPQPTGKGAELMAQWQATALNVKPKRPARDYMDLRFVNEVLVELGTK